MFNKAWGVCSGVFKGVFKEVCQACRSASVTKLVKAPTFAQKKVLRVIAKRTLRAFWDIHPESEQQLLAWYREASKADWSSPNEIKAQYTSASILKQGRVVFNICGNKYRLVVEINYPRRWVFVRFIGSHKEYDKIDANSI